MITLTITTQLALSQTRHDTWQENPILQAWLLSDLSLFADGGPTFNEMLAFNFASRTFASKRLAQGLSRSMSAVSSFMREYLDPVVKVDQCAQHVDDFEIAANNATDLTGTFGQSSRAFSMQDWKWQLKSATLESGKLNFLGEPFHPRWVTPQSRKVQIFWNKVRFPKSKKALQSYLGLVNYYENYIPRMAEKLNPFYKLWKQKSQSKSLQSWKKPSIQ